MRAKKNERKKKFGLDIKEEKVSFLPKHYVQRGETHERSENDEMKGGGQGGGGGGVAGTKAKALSVPFN